MVTLLFLGFFGLRFGCKPRLGRSVSSVSLYLNCLITGQLLTIGNHSATGVSDKWMKRYTLFGIVTKSNLSLHSPKPSSPSFSVLLVSYSVIQHFSSCDKTVLDGFHWGNDSSHCRLSAHFIGYNNNPSKMLLHKTRVVFFHDPCPQVSLQRGFREAPLLLTQTCSCFSATTLQWNELTGHLGVVN